MVLLAAIHLFFRLFSVPQDKRETLREERGKIKRDEADDRNDIRSQYNDKIKEAPLVCWFFLLLSLVVLIFLSLVSSSFLLSHPIRRLLARRSPLRSVNQIP